MRSQSYTANQYAVLSIPGSNARSGNRDISCEFKSLQGNRLQLEAQEEPPRSVPIGVQYDDVLFLGEVITSASTAGGTWQAEVLVQETLSGLQSLMNLRASLLGANPVVRCESIPMSICA